MNIPMVDLRQQYQVLKGEIDAALLNALSTTQFVLGPNVLAFEQEVADYLGVSHAIGVASGTDALQLALAAAGVSNGDEVITSALTFIATAEAICHLGATPVFVDIDPDTFNIDPNQIEHAITDKTRAVIPVHLFGQPAEMKTISALCRDKNIKIIEDSSQSFGAHINRKMTGSFGDFGAFSFFPSKNLGCFGDGGLITTSDASAAEDVRALHNHGSCERDHHDIIGYNSRLDEIQAAVLRIKLKHIDEYNTQRRRVAHRYTQAFSDTSIKTPFEAISSFHVYHQYTLLHEQRDNIMQSLQEHDIASAIYYPVPLHRQKAFKAYASLQLPKTELVTSHCLSLPIYPELEDEKIDHIVSIVKENL